MGRERGWLEREVTSDAGHRAFCSPGLIGFRRWLRCSAFAGAFRRRLPVGVADIGRSSSASSRTVSVHGTCTGLAEQQIDDIDAAFR